MIAYLLGMLVFSPVAGMLCLAFTRKTNESRLKLLGLLGTLPPLILSLIIYQLYGTGIELSDFSIKVDWMRFGNLLEYDATLYTVPFELGIDGFSLMLLVLTAILSTMASVASIFIKKDWKGYFLLFFLMEMGLFGVFSAQNLILFFIFFELSLVMLFFLIGKWGNAHKEKTSFPFLIFNGISSGILLIVIMILFARTGTTNIQVLTQLMTYGGPTLMAPISGTMKDGLLFALLLAFAMKLRFFPLHRWMVDVYVQGPPPTVMMHAGVLLNIGTYGVIRFGMGLFPEQFQSIAFIISILGVVSFLYGACLALFQTDLKKVLAYSTVSHMGLVFMGIGSMNEAGIQGAIFQLFSHGLTMALMFFLVGILYEQFKTTSISELGGITKSMPVFSGFLLAGVMASLGVPGMSGFMSGFMVFLGLFQKEATLAAVGAIGIFLTAISMLKVVLAITYGGKESAKTQDLQDFNMWEQWPAYILLGIIVWIGIYPPILSGPIQETIAILSLRLGGIE